MAYVLLAMAIVFELMGTTLMKYSIGFTKILPSIGCLVCYFICFFTFARALTRLNMGAAYATWSAVGTVAAAVLSAVLFGEKLNAIGITAIVVIIIACAILNLFGIKG